MEWTSTRTATSTFASLGVVSRAQVLPDCPVVFRSVDSDDPLPAVNSYRGQWNQNGNTVVDCADRTCYGTCLPSSPRWTLIGVALERAPRIARGVQLVDSEGIRFTPQLGVQLQWCLPSRSLRAFGAPCGLTQWPTGPRPSPGLYVYTNATWDQQGDVSVDILAGTGSAPHRHSRSPPARTLTCDRHSQLSMS